jgi:DNA-binding NarL/FixJ family response regulator
MKSLRLILANTNLTAVEKVILLHHQSHEFEVVIHKQSLLQKLDEGSDAYVIELNNLTGRNLLKCLEEKKIWSIVIVKDSSLLREVVGCTHTVCLYPQYTINELHTAMTKILALLKSQNEVARPVFSKQAIINPHLSKILTLREQEMLADITQGKMYKEIAETKGITLGTVKQHIHKIYNKMQVNNKIEALNMCSMGV